MNIFALDQEPRLAASYHCDPHVVKMVLETAQILCTAAQMNGVSETPYKPTHRKHPAVLWAADTRDNYAWLVELGVRLGGEFFRRYGKAHASCSVIWTMKKVIGQIRAGSLTEFAQCMPEECRIPNNPVQAYRGYYANHKRNLLRYNHGPTPPWL